MMALQKQSIVSVAFPYNFLDNCAILIRPINELLDFYSVRNIYFYFNPLLVFSKEMPKCFPSGIKNPLFSLGKSVLPLVWLFSLPCCKRWKTLETKTSQMTPGTLKIILTCSHK